MLLRGEHLSSAWWSELLKKLLGGMEVDANCLLRDKRILAV